MSLYAEAADLIRRRSVEVDSGCWEWVGATDKGYGQLTFKGKHHRAHRLSFAAFNGGITPGAWVLHKCDNRRCVNPDHLYQGSAADNRADAVSRNRWAHPWASRQACAAGHEYAEHGFTVSKKDGSRVCRTCQREAKRKQRLRRASQ